MGCAQPEKRRWRQARDNLSSSCSSSSFATPRPFGGVLMLVTSSKLSKLADLFAVTPPTLRVDRVGNRSLVVVPHCCSPTWWRYCTMSVLFSHRSIRVYGRRTLLPVAGKLENVPVDADRVMVKRHMRNICRERQLRCNDRTRSAERHLGSVESIFSRHSQATEA